MGVPAFFRWLTIRYPQVVVDALTEDDMEVLHAEYQAMKQAKEREAAGPLSSQEQRDLDEELELVKARRISQNNPQVDNLYLDMNGIIHPCCHPQDKPQPKSETEMFALIVEYVDRLLDIVKPKKVLYLAIDGVAPRAKMNQQRSRRFRTALDAQEKAEREAAIKNKWAAAGIKFSDQQAQSQGESFDSNVITPGTEFMDNLSKALHEYIVARLQSSERWDGLKVIFSDAFVPGEGEHKILDFIRSQRAQDGYSPNTSHCIHGADADLIMLGLSTHEPNFYILRETPPQHGNQNRQGRRDRDGRGDGPRQAEEQPAQKTAEFQFVKLSVIREYLCLEFKELRLPFAFDLERLVDDFVFLCFFVGNDFLPHLPSLSIREGAIDALMFIYKNQLPGLGDYLTDGAGGLNFSKVDVLLHQVAMVEEEFFKQHQRNAERNELRRKQDEERDRLAEERKQNEEFDRLQSAQGAAGGGNTAGSKSQSADQLAQGLPKEAGEAQMSAKASTDLKKKDSEALEEQARAEVFEQIMKQDELDEEQKKAEVTKKLKELARKQVEARQMLLVEAYEDKVQLTKEGWKRRYYHEKFHVSSDEEFAEFSKGIRQKYIEGLAWVLAYYYKGCRSWSWFYPYHYAPFASDLLGCDSLKIEFDLGVPAKPFQQLLAVFPKQSAHALPSCYHKLYEPDSEVIGFYPSEVELDLNGARYAWMGVNLLPYIEWDRLLAAVRKADKDETLLTPAERTRNKPTGEVRLYFQQAPSGTKSKLQAELLKDFGQGNDQGKGEEERVQKVEASFKSLDGIAGSVTVPEGSFGGVVEGKNKAGGHRNYRSLLGRESQGVGLDEADPNRDTQPQSVAIMVHYQLPEYKGHIPSLLPNAAEPKREVDDFAIYHIDRRVFQGEAAIRIVERVFGIDASRDPVYNFSSGPRNFNGQQYGGYRNNHAVYGAESGFIGMPRAGQRRRYQEFQSAQLQRGDPESDRDPHEHAKRRRLSPGRQDDYARPNIDYNLRKQGGGNSNSVYQNYMRRLAEPGRDEAGSTNPLPQLLDKFNDGGRNHQYRQEQTGSDNILAKPDTMPGQHALARFERAYQPNGGPQRHDHDRRYDHRRDAQRTDHQHHQQPPHQSYHAPQRDHDNRGQGFYDNYRAPRGNHSSYQYNQPQHWRGGGGPPRGRGDPHYRGQQFQGNRGHNYGRY